MSKESIAEKSKDAPRRGPHLSLVTPAYNEKAGIKEALSQFACFLSLITEDWEIIVVDDGSSDDTFEEVRKACEMEPKVRGIRLSRNFGKEGALLAGLEHASGDAVITIDSDLQHPPEVISQLVEEWRKGALVVHAVKRQRKADGLYARVRASIFNKSLSIMSGIDMANSSDFKLLDRVAVESIVKGIGERQRFYRGLAQWVGFRQASVSFDVKARNTGKGKWSVLDLLNLAATGVVSFTSAPLRIVSVLGFITLVFGIIIATDALWSFFSGYAVSGFATTIMTIMIIGSFMMISLGIIGEYIAKIYEEVKRRPSYLIDSIVNFPANPDSNQDWASREGL